jgi:hypothetical protein
MREMKRDVNLGCKMIDELASRPKGGQYVNRNRRPLGSRLGMGKGWKLELLLSRKD